MPIYEEKKKRNGQKRYYISTYVKDENGKSKKITRRNKEWVGRNGYFLAQQEEIFLKQKKETNNYFRQTLEQLYNLFLEHKKRTIKESTLLKLQENYNNYIDSFFKDKFYYDLTPLDIENWKEFMYNKKLSFNTMKNTFTTLSSILEYGCQYYELPKNVARIAKNFKQVKGIAKNKINFITQEQFENAINYEDNFLYKTAFTILFYTGMRRGEMLSLSVNDLNFEENTIKIDETINPKISKVPTTPKTDKSNRVIEVLPFIMDMIKQVIKDYDCNDYIFLDKIKLTTLKSKCDRILLKSGLKEDSLIRIHDLRHSFASMCINKGVEIQIISDYMGHENISITWDTYGHLYPNSQKELLQKISK